jgi:hypothetical protein
LQDGTGLAVELLANKAHDRFVGAIVRTGKEVWKSGVWFSFVLLTDEKQMFTIQSGGNAVKV